MTRTLTDIRCSNVSKRFGAVTALDSLDLHIQAGEFMALLGPSGSGKTTLLNLLAGLLRPDDGEIHIGDRRVDELPPNKRGLAMVFQSYALYPHLTVFENLAFPLKARRGAFKRQEIEAKVAKVSLQLGIDQLLHRYPKELSGGQQQRVALGRALIRDPMVFLLDEPLSNLDARLRIRMRADIKALHEQLASTIVYVTHDQAEAMALADRIAVFAGGRLQQVGTPDEIYNQPANRFVANFVGDREINLLEGQATPAQGGGSDVVGPGFRLHLPAVDLSEPRAALLGIRPEALALCEPEFGDLSGVVRLTELIGPDVFAYVDVADSTSVVCRLDPARRVTRGQQVSLRVDPEGAYLFDAEHERRL